MEMAGDYRNPAIPAFDTTPLIKAYNACLPNQAESFGIGVQECCMEFMSCPGLRGNGLINNLRLQDGFLTTFVESGVCMGCHQLHELVII